MSEVESLFLINYMASFCCCASLQQLAPRDPFTSIYSRTSHLRFRLNGREKLSSEAVEESESGPAPTPAASEVVVDPVDSRDDLSYLYAVGGEVDGGMGATATASPDDRPVSISKSTLDLSSMSSSSEGGSVVSVLVVDDDPVDFRDATCGLSTNSSSTDSGVSEEFHGFGRVSRDVAE